MNFERRRLSTANRAEYSIGRRALADMRGADDWMLMRYERHGTTCVRHDVLKEKEIPHLGTGEASQDSAFKIENEASTRNSFRSSDRVRLR